MKNYADALEEWDDIVGDPSRQHSHDAFRQSEIYLNEVAVTESIIREANRNQNWENYYYVKCEF